MTGPPRPDQPSLPVITNHGRRYLLGYGRDFYGIWDRNLGGAPIRRFPLEPDGWAQAFAEFQRAEGSGSAATASPSSTGPRMLLLIGGGCVALAPFLTWVNVFLVGPLNLFSLASLAASTSTSATTSTTGALPVLPWAGPAIGAFALLVALRGSLSGIRTAGVVLGLVAGVGGGVLLARLLQVVNGSVGFVRLGAGAWTGLAGAGAMVIAGLWPVHH